MTHDELVARALRWVRITMKYPVAAVEVPGYIESPDVIGFKHLGATSILVECKTNRKDFLKDTKKKAFRKLDGMGMGKHRWFFAPSGVIYPNELPPKWGLACLKGKVVRIIKKAETFDERSREGEAVALYTMVQRATEGWGRKIFGDAAPPLVDGDPHPTTFGLLKKLRAELEAAKKTNVEQWQELSALRGRLADFTGEGLQ